MEIKTGIKRIFTRNWALWPMVQSLRCCKARHQTQRPTPSRPSRTQAEAAVAAAFMVQMARTETLQRKRFLSFKHKFVSSQIEWCANRDDGEVSKWPWRSWRKRTEGFKTKVIRLSSNSKGSRSGFSKQSIDNLNHHNCNWIAEMF